MSDGIYQQLQKAINILRLSVTAGTFIGAIIFGCYFLTLHYLPKMDFGAIIYVFIAVPAYFSLVAIAFSLNLSYPAVLWSQLFKNPRTRIMLAGKKRLNGFVRFNGFNLKINRDSVGILRLVGIYSLLIFVYTSVTIYARPLGYAWLSNFLMCFSIISFYLFISIFLTSKYNQPGIYKLYRKFSPGTYKKLRKCHAILQFLATIGVVSLPIFFAAYFVGLMNHKVFHDEHGNFYDLLWLFVIILFSSFCFLTGTKNTNIYKWSAISSLVGTALILLYLSAFTNLFKFFVDKMIFGNITGSSFIVDKDACLILQAAKYKITCQSNTLYKLQHVKMKWRIGEAYITFKDKNNHDAFVIFDAKHILGIIAPAKEPKAKHH